jgi:hypothetical protein
MPEYFSLFNFEFGIWNTAFISYFVTFGDLWFAVNILWYYQQFILPDRGKQ